MVNEAFAMAVTTKPMETPAEMEGRGYVHWKAWQETYTGLIDQSYLDSLSLEKQIGIARQHPENTLVAKDGDRVVGFVVYGPYRWEDLPSTGEVMAIYILKEYYGQKVGYALMHTALKALSGYGCVALWVLKGNERAIRFYEKCGFRFDGAEKTGTMGRPVTELRMIWER